MTKFTEKKLEQVFVELLGNEGFPHHLGNTISRLDYEVLIEEDLKQFLLAQYQKEKLKEFIMRMYKPPHHGEIIRESLKPGVINSEPVLL